MINLTQNQGAAACTLFNSLFPDSSVRIICVLERQHPELRYNLRKLTPQHESSLSLLSLQAGVNWNLVEL